MGPFHTLEAHPPPTPPPHPHPGREVRWWSAPALTICAVIKTVIFAVVLIIDEDIKESQISQTTIQ